MQLARHDFVMPGLIGLAVLLVIAESAFRSANAEPAQRPPEEIYATVCGYCHGRNVGPIILGRNLPPEAIELFVRTGQGAMPAFKPTEITDEELTALARWVGDAEASEQEHGK